MLYDTYSIGGVLYHADRANHKYIKKVKTKNGKWRYIYKNALNKLMANSREYDNISLLNSGKYKPDFVDKHEMNWYNEHPDWVKTFPETYNKFNQRMEIKKSNEQQTRNETKLQRMEDERARRNIATTLGDRTAKRVQKVLDKKMNEVMNKLDYKANKINALSVLFGEKPDVSAWNNKNEKLKAKKLFKFT